MKLFSSAFTVLLVSMTAVHAIPAPVMLPVGSGAKSLGSSAHVLTNGAESLATSRTRALESNLADTFQMPLKKKQKLNTGISVSKEQALIDSLKARIANSKARRIELENRLKEMDELALKISNQMTF